MYYSSDLDTYFNEKEDFIKQYLECFELRKLSSAQEKIFMRCATTI